MPTESTKRTGKKKEKKNKYLPAKMVEYINITMLNLSLSR
jgi:hypothetical protein